MFRVASIASPARSSEREKVLDISTGFETLSNMGTSADPGDGLLERSGILGTYARDHEAVGPGMPSGRAERMEKSQEEASGPGNGPLAGIPEARRPGATGQQNAQPDAMIRQRKGEFHSREQGTNWASKQGSKRRPSLELASVLSASRISTRSSDSPMLGNGG